MPSLNISNFKKHRNTQCIQKNNNETKKSWNCRSTWTKVVIIPICNFCSTYYIPNNPGQPFWSYLRGQISHPLYNSGIKVFNWQVTSVTYSSWVEENKISNVNPLLFFLYSQCLRVSVICTFVMLVSGITFCRNENSEVLPRTMTAIAVVHWASMHTVYLYISHNTSSMVLAKWFSIFVTAAFIGILCSKRFQSNRTLEGCSVQSWDDSQHKIKLLRWLCKFISKLFDNLHSNSETLVVYMHIHLCYQTTLNATLTFQSGNYLEHNLFQQNFLGNDDNEWIIWVPESSI